MISAAEKCGIDFVRGVDFAGRERRFVWDRFFRNVRIWPICDVHRDGYFARLARLEMSVARRVRQIVGFSLVAALVVILPLMSAYADWLRFSSPHAPDVQTGQIIYLKAARGVFYITREQERLVGPASMFLVFILGLGGMTLLALDRQKGDAIAPMWLRVLAWVLAGYWFLMFAAPDHAMALLFTGSLTPPIDAHQFEPTVVPNH